MHIVQYTAILSRVTHTQKSSIALAPELHRVGVWMLHYIVTVGQIDDLQAISKLTACTNLHSGFAIR